MVEGDRVLSPPRNCLRRLRFTMANTPSRSQVSVLSARALPSCRLRAWTTRRSAPGLIGVIDVLHGLGDDGLVVVNTAKSPGELDLNTKAKVITVDATNIAVEELGKPIPNTVMIGAFAGATGLVTIESVEKAVRHRFEGKLGEMNARACRRAFNEAKEAK